MEDWLWKHHLGGKQNSLLLNAHISPFTWNGKTPVDTKNLLVSLSPLTLSLFQLCHDCCDPQSPLSWKNTCFFQNTTLACKWGLISQTKEEWRSHDVTTTLPLCLLHVIFNSSFTFVSCIGFWWTFLTLIMFLCCTHDHPFVLHRLSEKLHVIFNVFPNHMLSFLFHLIKGFNKWCTSFLSVLLVCSPFQPCCFRQSMHVKHVSQNHHFRNTAKSHSSLPFKQSAGAQAGNEPIKSCRNFWWHSHGFTAVLCSRLE